MVSNKKMSSKSKGKTIGTYLKTCRLFSETVILYACKCWDDSVKNEIFANKIEQFCMSMCKQIYVLKILPTEHHLKQISKQKYLSICKDLHLSTRVGSRDAGTSKRSILDVAEP